MASLILIRGGGDLASGTALRLIHAGLKVVITELPQPLAVRRTVAFAEAIYEDQITIEGITARCVPDPSDSLRILNILVKGQIPVLMDPDCSSAKSLHPAVILDARMTKYPPEAIGYSPSLYVGLGPGFIAGHNCQVVIETKRGPTLGRVYWQGMPERDSSQPEGDPARVLHAPADGEIITYASIGDRIETGQVIAEVAGEQIHAPFPGILRGLIHPGLGITRGTKIGDLDPRDDPRLCTMVSDKSLAIGGGVLEAILTRREVRKLLWD